MNGFQLYIKDQYGRSAWTQCNGAHMYFIVPKQLQYESTYMYINVYVD